MNDLHSYVDFGDSLRDVQTHKKDTHTQWPVSMATPPSNSGPDEPDQVAIWLAQGCDACIGILPLNFSSNAQKKFKIFLYFVKSLMHNKPLALKGVAYRPICACSCM